MHCLYQAALASLSTQPGRPHEYATLPGRAARAHLSQHHPAWLPAHTSLSTTQPGCPRTPLSPPPSLAAYAHLSQHHPAWLPAHTHFFDLDEAVAQGHEVRQQHGGRGLPCAAAAVLQQLDAHLCTRVHMYVCTQHSKASRPPCSHSVRMFSEGSQATGPRAHTQAN